VRLRASRAIPRARARHPATRDAGAARVAAPRSRRPSAARRRRRPMSTSTSSRETSRGFDELVHDARLERGVARVRHDAKVRLGPGAMQIPRALDRADHVVAALHDHGGDVANARDLVDELILTLEKAAVHEVVTFDAREREAELVAGAAR